MLKAKKLVLVSGAGPNFMKIAPIIRAMKKHHGLTTVRIHNKQHYDKNMSRIFFDSFGIPDSGGT